jgi:hypothetical protein
LVGLARPAVQPASRLIDQEPGTFQRGALRGEFECEHQGIWDYARKPSHL